MFSHKFNWSEIMREREREREREKERFAFVS